MDDYIKRDLLTYIGNKRKLLPHIDKEILNIKKKLNKEKITSLDGFSGSGCVAKLLKTHSNTLYVNDLEEYSYIVNKCYLSEPSEDKIKKNK